MANEKERGPRRVWSTSEEQVLIGALHELVKDGWKCQNNTFKPGYVGVLEKALQTAFPGTDLRGYPHIESKMKQWKKHYNSLVTMVNTSGFGFNEVRNRIEVADDSVWNEYLKKDKTARGMRDKDWPLFNDWGLIFGKDRATGELAMDLEDMGQEADNVTMTDTHGAVADVAEGAEGGSQSVNANANANPDPEASIGSGRLKRKFNGADAIAHGLEQVSTVFSEYMVECGKKLDNIAQRVGYEQDVAEGRRKVYAELAKMPSLGVDERFEIGYKIASDPLTVDFFFSLDDSDRPGWVRRMNWTHRAL